MSKKNIGRRIAFLVVFCFSILFHTGFTLKERNSSLTAGNTYSGFRLITVKYVEEIQSRAFIFSHIKSGARLIFLQNDDDNKVFSIAFRTPAADNTGVKHILEHSVLDGSFKYPVKSPFLEIGKRSLNTFLNAYTASDRTVYPVASRNEKDFKNLMSIYLDAVFNPNVIKDKRIFLQEAGHYELSSAFSALSYKGVVYNEMKGDLSSPESLLSQRISESLFPDTAYRWNSGGTPEEIQKLTWEQLKRFYKDYYAASNCYIYLYGNLDIIKYLEYLDDEYLGRFKYKKANTKEALQLPYGGKRVIIDKYPVDKEADPRKKAYLSLNYVIDSHNSDDVIGMMFLNYLLLGYNGAPLKSALLNKGLGGNVYGNINTDGAQPYYSIILEAAEAEKGRAFENTAEEALKGLLKSGFDRSYVNSLVHSYEINLKADRLNAKRGITYNDMIMASWVNGYDPLQYLSINAAIRKIKKSVSEGYFERLVDKYLLNSKLNSIVVLKPIPGLAEEMEAGIRENLKRKKEKLSPREIGEIIKQTEEIREWQAAPNSEEALKKLPSMELKDLKKQADIIPLKVKYMDGIKLLEHRLFTDNIVYSDIYFDTTKVPQDKLPYLYLLASLLGQLDTSHYTYSQLINKANSCVGRLSFVPCVMTKFDDINVYYPKLDISFYTLASDLTEAFDIIKEILNCTRFDNKPLLRQYLGMMKTSIDNNIVNSGLQIAESRLQSYYSEFGKYNDISSIPFYKFIIDANKNFDSNYDEIKDSLMEVAGLVFDKSNMTASVTCDKAMINVYEKCFEVFGRRIRESRLKRQHYLFNSHSKNEAYMTTSQVQYIAMGYDINKLGYKYNGKMRVLSSIINGDYIWNKVRELGGAYGGAFTISSNGNAEFLSWRDPNLGETLEIFKKTGNFIKNMKLSNKDVENYIISTIGSMDRPLSPEEKGKTSDINYFSGITQKFLQNQRNEILEATASDIRNYAGLLNLIAKENNFCVFGSRTKIMDNKGIFMVTRNLENS